MATQLEQIAAEAMLLVSQDYDIKVCQWCWSGDKCNAERVDFYHNRVARQMYIPAPENEECLFILLHEVGHAALRHGPPCLARDTEQQATEWAIKFAAERGLNISPQWRETMLGFARDFETHWDEGRVAFACSS